MALLLRPYDARGEDEKLSSLSAERRMQSAPLSVVGFEVEAPWSGLHLRARISGHANRVLWGKR